jgi:hypothetical protein
MTEQPTTEDSTPCHIERSSARIATETFVNAVSTVHLRCDFAKFCELLDLKADEYSQEKWRLFNELMQRLNDFDLLTLTKIVEAGYPNSEQSVLLKPQAFVEPSPVAEPSSNEASP